jgi:hypothetical protein
MHFNINSPWELSQLSNLYRIMICGENFYPSGYASADYICISQTCRAHNI